MLRESCHPTASKNTGEAAEALQILVCSEEKVKNFSPTRLRNSIKLLRNSGGDT